MCCTCKVAFLLIRPIVVFRRFPPLSITRFYILFEQTINIIESFAAVALAKSINNNYSHSGANWNLEMLKRQMEETDGTDDFKTLSMGLKSMVSYNHVANLTVPENNHFQLFALKHHNNFI